MTDTNKPSQSKHPTPNELRNFMTGKLGETQSTDIESHLQNCKLCTDFLASTSTDDVFVELIRQAENTEQSQDTLQQVPPRHIGGYQIIEKLGKGGMGIVYRAFDPRLKREVALKLISTGLSITTESSMRLRKEAETIARLQHPGIMQIYEIGEHEGNFYLVLELLHPGGLFTITEKQQKSPAWKAALIWQLAETVHYAHQAGIVHRDLKPANVLPALEASGISLSNSSSWWTEDVLNLPRVKLTDFGLAKCLDDDSQLTRTGIMLGTPDYMAPEQLPDSGEPIGPATDIYALGVMLYQLLTDRLPLKSESISQFISMLSNDDPVPPRRLNPSVPPDLETLCLKCLMKKPAERYASAQALADDLFLFLQGESILARPLNWFQRLKRWARRKPILAGHYLGIIILYSFHLFVMLVLQLPHQGFFHALVTSLVIFWFWAATTTQRLVESKHWQRLGEYIYTTLPTLLVSIGFSVHKGPSSVPIDIYSLFIVISVFIYPHPRIVWFQTILSIFSYLSITAIAWWFKPENLVSLEKGGYFLINLFFMGVLMHLILRRTQKGNF